MLDNWKTDRQELRSVWVAFCDLHRRRKIFVTIESFHVKAAREAGWLDPTRSHPDRVMISAMLASPEDFLLIYDRFGVDIFRSGFLGVNVNPRELPDLMLKL